MKEFWDTVLSFFLFIVSVFFAWLGFIVIIALTMLVTAVFSALIFWQFSSLGLF